MKKILLFPVRNEEWILEQTLPAASLWADHIIVADHNSSDATPDILRRFPKVSIIQNTNEFHTSTIRRELLAEARKIDGPKVIFSFDADEIPTADILNSDFWGKIAKLPPGTAIELLWVNLWRSTEYYRVDAGPQAPAWKAFGFVDDGKAEYTSLGVINDHTSRLPSGLGSTVRFQGPRVLHFQFVDWQRMMSKQAHYRMTEWLQKDKDFLTAWKINLKYYGTKDERGLQLAPVPKEWSLGYEQHGVSMALPTQAVNSWHDKKILEYMQQYGADFFETLDIWDVSWAERASVSAHGAYVSLPPRGSRWFKRAVRGHVLRICSYRNWLLRLYGMLRWGAGQQSFLFRHTYNSTLKIMSLLRKICIYGRNQLIVWHFQLKVIRNAHRMLRDASLFLEYYRRPVSAPPEFTLDFVAGFQLRCSTADLSAVAETCITEDYAPKSEFYIRQGMTVLDIGANMGSYTIWAAHQGARVYALEPERNNVVRLEANIQLNKLQPNIIVVPDAIFSHTGVVRLAVSGLSPGGHTTGVIDGVEVPSVTIADLLIRENIDSVDILKIDVEGAEYEIFGSIEKETFSKINSIVGEYHLRPGRLENFQTLYKILSPHYAHVKSYYPFYFYAHN